MDDLETVLSGHPTLEYSTFEKQFSYLNTGGDPLEQGANYYWFVKSLAATSNGLEEFNSEVWQFTVNAAGGSARLSYLKELLKTFFGPLSDKIMQQLADSELKMIRVNNEIISLNDLILLFESYQTNNITIQNIEIH